MRRCACCSRARKGCSVLVTAGPTEEPVDAVRVLTNRSSGRMGVALAEAARDRGHRVTLVAGPLRCPPPMGVERIDVTTAREMEQAVRDAEPRRTSLVMAAAVADYRPAQRETRKIASGAAALNLPLVPNPDILASVGPAGAAAARSRSASRSRSARAARSAPTRSCTRRASI